MTTKPLKLFGQYLHVNGDRQFVRLRVGVLRADGQPWAGYRAADCLPITADGTDLCTRRKDHAKPERPADQAVSLRFSLRRRTCFRSGWTDRDLLPVGTWSGREWAGRSEIEREITF